MLCLEAITIQSRRPSALAPFWSAVLGLPIDPTDRAAIEDGTLGVSESVLLGRRDALHVWVSTVEHLAPPGGRVHLEVRVAGHDDLDRLTEIGATLRRVDPDGRWRVYADPEGNEFCAVLCPGVAARGV